jgi:peptidoglycan lytic transglycosylase B
VFDAAMVGVKPSRRVISFDRKQPERRLSFLKYRRSRADAYRIKLGKREYRKHHALLKEVGSQYRVDPCILVSVWGLESSYGRYKGKFPVIKSLATLAYDDRRSAFFRKELLHALHIVQGGHIELRDFKGERAGGSGHPQFLPSSWKHYAVDHDKDGRKDIWGNIGDTFASIANYYAENGWQYQQPWAAKVQLPSHFEKQNLGYKTHKTIAQWKQLGVKIDSLRPIPGDDAKAWVVQPYGGPTIMAFENFRVMIRYNSARLDDPLVSHQVRVG